jgi:hypothetical protein
MRNAKLYSEKNSGATSATRQQLLRPRQGERSFLANQAADAKIAMTRTLHHMKENLKRVADLRLIAKQHPWLVLGSAVAAGFAAGAALTPAPRKKIKKTRSNSEAASEPNCQEEATQTKKSLMFSNMGRVLVGVLQTVLQSSIAAAVLAKDQPPVEEPSPHEWTETV